jgi:enoyl-CoA hydratase
VAADQLMPTAHAVAQEFKKLNMKAHTNTKLKVRKGLLDALDIAIEADKLSGLH